MEATSFFIDTPGSVPPEPGAPFWGARAESGPFEDGSVGTCFHVAHDPEKLYFVVRNEEPDIDAVWARRKSGQTHLELDDCIELGITPVPRAKTGSGGKTPPEDAPSWTLLVTAGGAWSWKLPDEAVPPPETDVRVAKLRAKWTVFAGFSVPDLAPAGELRGTPLDGEEWRLRIRRFRRHLPPAYEREVMTWGGTLRFAGGRAASPVRLQRRFEAGYGVTEVRLDFGGPIPEGVELSLTPRPAKRLRAKDSSRLKCRVARAGTYRFRLWLPEKKEEEGEILPQYCAGLSFRLEDYWAELDRIESSLGELKERLGEEEKYPEEARQALVFFEGAVIQLDRYRAPYVKDRLAPEAVSAVRSSFADARAALRKALIDRGQLHAVSPYAERGKWYRGALHLRTDHSGGPRKPAEIVKALKDEGYSFVGFADPPHGGDQDGDGRHDWNKDGKVSKKAKNFKSPDGKKFVVPADRGREAYVRDYSRTAKQQGFSWVKNKWKLSVPDEFVVLSGSELDVYARVSCYGLPPGAVSNDYAEGKRARFSVLSTPGCSTVPLPEEIRGVQAIENDDSLWEKHLTGGARMHFVLAPDGEMDEGGRTMDVYVLADELTEEAILSALAAGSFYTTSGPKITAVRAEGASVTVELEDPCQILFVSAGGEILGGDMAASFTYTFTGKENYARAVCLEDVEEDGFKHAAYTQAFYLSDELPGR